MVGFQTKLKYAAQAELLRTIPGLEKAEFARMGGLHRNTFINAPKLLDKELRLKKAPHIRFAGQITGCEGYVESAAVGLMVGLMVAAELRCEPLNITLWVVSFGNGVSETAITNLENCATSGKFYNASSSADLLNNFRSIANDISQLRLTN
jgi:tRNA:m(5)U-54 methyltransferase